jgi:type VII secretion effector (TIGR04197 family)
MHQPHDYVNQPHDYIPTAVIHDQRRPRINWAAAGAYITAALGLDIAIAVTALFLSHRETAATQISHLRQALSTAQSAQPKSDSSLSGLAGKVTGIDNALAALAPYSTVCSQDLTGPNGPAAFYFPCTDQKP